ncbi:multiple epidermal growth factor-like domains protein 6 [Pomacea canaliculata]|uniref:multiple epidermal growth factor-like domains protein 6 n=1 Tax=Pomacea canaliculata TaxID=400727 RepID=UPI000D72A539|nr:multiple epidermal growth factor-like domains protein 6 [Pomacea canaliculata]
MMAGRVCQEIYKLCVFTEILILCFGQSTHMRNIALNKRCGISSRYVTSYNLSSGDCSAVINGNTNTVLHLNSNPPNCIHTAVNDLSPFWWVDLGQEVAISVITIYGRNEYIDRMRCVNVSVDGKVVKRFVDRNVWSNDKYSITVVRRGQVVNFTKDCDFEETMNFCEVQVWVCDDGWYGDCTQACGRCAGGAVCDKVDGSCTSCQTGFQLPTCKVCTDGWYGDNCTQTCGNCANNSVCDKTTGRCTSCTTGFNPPLCKECAYGWYGDSCLQTCGNCVGNSVCDKTTGSCSSCQTGFYPPLCKECQLGWYGNSCQDSCGHCVGGNTTCDKVSGSCPSCDGAFQPPLCKDMCDDGWYGDNCTQACGHCVGGSVCDKVYGYCTSCETGFQLPRCDATSDKDKETVSLAGPMAGVAVGCSVAFFIIGLVTGLCLRKFRIKHPSSSLRSPDDTSMTHELGTSIPIPHHEEKPDISPSSNTSDYSNINVYEALKGGDDDTTSPYTSLSLPPTRG